MTSTLTRPKQTIAKTIIYEGTIYFYKTGWRYVYPNGKTCFFFARFEDGHGKKQFRPYYRLDDGSLKMGLPQGQKLPLLKADELWKNKFCPILIVEGEKCATCTTAVNLEAMGWIVICLPTTAKRTDWTPVMDRKEIFIFPDKDKSGYVQAAAILDFLPWAKVIPPFPEWPVKADIADFDISGNDLLTYIETVKLIGKEELEKIIDRGII